MATSSRGYSLSKDFAEMIDRAFYPTVSALNGKAIPFCVAGGLAAYLSGAPASSHDMDVIIQPRYLILAAEALSAAGPAIEVPEANWHIKAWTGNKGSMGAGR
jgi:hypothetical protein